MSIILYSVANILGYLLYYFGLANFVRRVNRHNPKIFSFHGVGNRDSIIFCHLRDEISESVFEFQIQYISNFYNCISLKKLVKNVLSENIEPYLASITFDDGLKSVKKKALPILEKYEIYPFIFLNTATFKNDLLWTHKYYALVSKLGIEKLLSLFKVAKELNSPLALELQLRKRIKSIFENKKIDKIASENGIDFNKIKDSENIYLDLNDLFHLKTKKVEFGSHTENHLPLAFVDRKTIIQEIQNSTTFLSDRLNVKEYYLSFPFGQPEDYGKNTHNIAIRNGIAASFEVGSGYNRPKFNRSKKLFSRIALDNSDTSGVKLFIKIEILPMLKYFIKNLSR